MSKEYIEKESAKNELNRIERLYRDTYMSKVRAEMVSYCCKVVEHIPAADAVEVKRGRWTDHRTIEHDGEWYCTACGEEVTICSCGKDKTWKYPYCPNCGARMDGGGDE